LSWVRKRARCSGVNADGAFKCEKKVVFALL